MILKPVDDKGRRLKLLEDLQQSPVLDFTQKKWLRTESGSSLRGYEKAELGHQSSPIRPAT